MICATHHFAGLLIGFEQIRDKPLNKILGGKKICLCQLFLNEMWVNMPMGMTSVIWPTRIWITLSSSRNLINASWLPMYVFSFPENWLSRYIHRETNAGIFCECIVFMPADMTCVICCQTSRMYNLTTTICQREPPLIGVWDVTFTWWANWENRADLFSHMILSSDPNRRGLNQGPG